MGFTGGNNVGIRWAISKGAEYLLILNNDTILSPDVITNLLRCLEETPEAGIASPKIYYADDKAMIWYFGGQITAYPGQVYPYRGHIDRGQFLGRFDTQWCSGCAMLVRRKVFDEVGLFDDVYFIWSEEVDFSLRARSKGYRLIVDGSAVVWHKEYRSLGRASPGAIYYATRNRLILARRFWGNGKFLLFLLIFMCVRVVRTAQWLLQLKWPLIIATWAAVYDFWKGKFGKWDRHDKVYRQKR